MIRVSSRVCKGYVYSRLGLVVRVRVYGKD